MVDRSNGQPQSRVAIVTGGSRGIGWETVQVLAERGYAVVVNYVHDQQAADAAVDSILERRGSAVAIRANVADDLDVERLFGQTVETFGFVDAVVHAVRGQVSATRLIECSRGELDGLWASTVRATSCINRGAVRHIRDGGAIVNLFGSVAETSLPAYGGYAVAASAIETVTRTLALDLRTRSVTVNGVALDIEKPCAPQRVAEVVAFLLSDEGHDVTGQVLHLDQRTQEQ